jgi:PIN domain nuclease of toxin-antitoxin system
VKVLLDTHVLLWAAATPERLGGAEQLLIEADVRLLSTASGWELAIKQSLGKVDLGMEVASWFRRSVRELAAEPLEIRIDHVAALEQLPPVHRDPFDRLLIAQAVHEGALLLTADRALAAYGDVVRVLP